MDKETDWPLPEWNFDDLEPWDISLPEWDFD
jgi:hypothetical protein